MDEGSESDTDMSEDSPTRSKEFLPINLVRWEDDIIYDSNDLGRHKGDILAAHCSCDCFHPFAFNTGNQLARH